jgi:hypothetical protein
MRVWVCMILKKKKRTCVFKNVVKEDEQWFCIYVEDDLDLSIMFVIHWALSFCEFIFFVMFFFYCHLPCDLTCVVEECTNGVHKHGVICNVFLNKSLSM